MTAKATPKPPEQHFFVTSPLKIVILALTTLGYYQLYWMYKNWRILQPNDGKFDAGIRSVFGLFFAFSLLRKMQVRQAWLLASLYFVSGFMWLLPRPYNFLQILSCLVFATTQWQLNRRNNIRIKLFFSEGAIILMIVGMLLTAVNVSFALSSEYKSPRQIWKEFQQGYQMGYDQAIQQARDRQAALDEAQKRHTSESTGAEQPAGDVQVPPSISGTVSLTGPTDYAGDLIVSQNILQYSLSNDNALPTVEVHTPNGHETRMPAQATNQERAPFIFSWNTTAGPQPSKSNTWQLVLSPSSDIDVGTYSYTFVARDANNMRYAAEVLVEVSH